MNRTEFYALLNTIPTTIPIYTEDKHGVGKSECIYQFAVQNDMDYLCMILSQRTEGDFVGIPFINEIEVERNGSKKKEKFSVFAAPDIFARISTGKGILHLDEFPDASPDIRNAAQEIICARSFNGHRLGDGWRVILSGNPPDTNAYQTGDLRPQLLSRVLKVSFCVTTDEWLSYMKKSDGHPAVISFIAKNDTHLFPPEKLEMNKSTPCPRTWKYLSDIMKSSEEFANGSNLMTVANGLVGLESSVVFCKYVEKEFKMPKLSDIKRGKFNEAYLEDVPVCSGLARELAAEKIKDLKKAELDNISQWFEKVPKEVTATYVRSLISGTENSSIMESLTKMISLERICTILDGITEIESDVSKEEKKEEKEEKKSAKK